MTKREIDAHLLVAAAFNRLNSDARTTPQPSGCLRWSFIYDHAAKRGISVELGTTAAGNLQVSVLTAPDRCAFRAEVDSVVGQPAARAGGTAWRKFRVNNCEISAPAIRHLAHFTRGDWERLLVPRAFDARPL